MFCARILILSVTFLAMMFGRTPANAIAVDLVLDSNVVGIGESFDLAVVVSGLDGFGVIKGTAFSIIIDPVGTPSNVEYNSAVYGTGFITSTQLPPSVAPGVVSLSETSTASTEDLIRLQPSMFTLATLNFTAIAAGTTEFSFGSIILYDENGLAFTPDELGITRITVVPIPSGLFLFASVLAGMGLFGWRRKRDAAA